jgi:hypothetical protein
MRKATTARMTPKTKAAATAAMAMFPDVQYLSSGLDVVEGSAGSLLSTGVGAMSKAGIMKMRRRLSEEVARVEHAEFGPALYRADFGRELGSTNY